MTNESGTCQKCGSASNGELLEYNREGWYFGCGSRNAYCYTAGLKSREVFIQSDKCRIAELQNLLRRLLDLRTGCD